MKPHPLFVQLAMIGTMLLWGVSFVGTSIVLSEIGPLPYMGLRFTLAAVVLGIVLLVIGPPRFSRRTHGLIAVTALFQPVAYFLFETYGIERIGPTMTSLIIALIPLAVMVVAAVVLHEPIRLRGAIAVIVSMVGIALLVYGGDSSSQHALLIDPGARTVGVLLVLGAVFAAAGYITLARSLTQKHDPIRLTIFQTWWGALFFIAIWQVTTPGVESVVDLSPVAWGATVFLVLGATVTAFLLYNWALRYESAATAALYINAIPIVTAVTSWIVLGETLTPIQLAGAALVLAAVRVSTAKGAEIVTTPLPPEA